MLEFVAGIAIGAAFAPFWMKLYGMGKTFYTNFMKK
jgi:hypothetical protein